MSGLGISSRSLSGWYLVLAPVLALVAGLVSPAGWGDYGNSQTLLVSYSSNPDLVTISAFLIAVAFILFAAGISGLKDSMSDGKCGDCVKLGFLFVAFGVAATLIESGAHAAAGGAAAIPGGAGMGIGATLLAVAEGVGGLATATLFIGVALVGLAMVMQKNYHVVVGSLVAVVAVLGVVGAATDYYGDLMQYVWIAWAATTLVLGALTVRKAA